MSVMDTLAKGIIDRLVDLFFTKHRCQNLHAVHD